MRRRVNPIPAILLTLLIGGCKPTVDVSASLKAASVTSMSSASSTTTTAGTFIPASGSAYTSFTIDLGTQFLAENIASTVTIFGLAGNSSGSLKSGAMKDSTASQITQLTEVTTYAGVDLPSGYREIPVVAKDDDGGNTGSQVTKLTRGVGVWNGAVPRVVCGMGIGTIAGRVTDCDTRHSTKPSWDSSSADGKISWDGSKSGNGLGPEGSWTLVNIYSSSLSNGTTCNATCLEVWRDDQTGLLWSDRIGDPAVNTVNTSLFNWCIASGNMESAGGVDCTNGGTGFNTASISLCAEASGLTTPVGTHNTTNNTAGTAPGGTWSNTGTGVRDSKAGMLKTVNSDPAGGGLSPSVRWRLPTRWDYEQANNDGIHQVLPNFHSLTQFQWTATVQSFTRANGFYFSSLNGQLGANPRDTFTYAIRCVGR